MFKKTMKFDNLEGEEVTQTFYFNYNKKEIAELLEFGYITQFPPADGKPRERLEAQMERLTTPVEESGLSQVDNNKMAYDIFQDLILNAYGEKGADNVTFVKNQRTREFMQSHVAFVEIIFEFLENTALAAEFIEKCLPAKLVDQAKKEMAAEQGRKVSDETLAEMVEEAARRQQDPATRIEPGMDAAIEAGVATPEMAKLATAVAESETVTQLSIEDLSEEDILNMPEEEFKKLDPRKFSQPQLMAAFRRKSQEG